MTRKLSDYYFDLPKELIAQSPAPDRSSSRLLVYDKYDKSIKTNTFTI